MAGAGRGEQNARGGEGEYDLHALVIGGRVTRTRSSLVDVAERSGSSEGSVLQDLGVGDADAHHRGRVPDRMALQVPQFENASIVVRQGGQHVMRLSTCGVD